MRKQNLNSIKKTIDNHLIHIIKKGLQCEGMPSFPWCALTFLIHIYWQHIFELLKRNDSNPLNVKEFMDKTRFHIVTTLTLGSRLRQGLAKVWAKSEPRNHISCSQECKKVWGNESPHSQVNSHFVSWSPNGLLNLQRAILGVKTHWIKEFLISLKRFWNVDV